MLLAQEQCTFAVVVVSMMARLFLRQPTKLLQRKKKKRLMNICSPAFQNEMSTSVYHQEQRFSRRLVSPHLKVGHQDLLEFSKFGLHHLFLVTRNVAVTK